MPAKSSTKPPRKTSPKPRKSKVFTISLPPDLAKRAEAIAKSESRTMSELFRDAFRAYQATQTREWLDELRAYAATRNPHVIPRRTSASHQRSPRGDAGSAGS